MIDLKYFYDSNAEMPSHMEGLWFAVLKMSIREFIESEGNNAAARNYLFDEGNEFLEQTCELLEILRRIYGKS